METIKRPVITEKTLLNYKNNKQVAFEIDINADKTQAIKSIEAIYGVKVLSAQVSNRLGKYKADRKTRRRLVKLQDKKIMVFRIRPNDEIDIFNS